MGGFCVDVLQSILLSAWFELHNFREMLKTGMDYARQT